MKTTLFPIAILAAIAVSGCQEEDNVVGKEKPIQIEKPEMYFESEGGTDSTQIDRQYYWISHYEFQSTDTSILCDTISLAAGNRYDTEWFTLDARPNLLKVAMSENNTEKPRKLKIRIDVGNTSNVINITQKEAKEEH